MNSGFSGFMPELIPGPMHAGIYDRMPRAILPQIPGALLIERSERVFERISTRVSEETIGKTIEIIFEGTQVEKSKEFLNE